MIEQLKRYIYDSKISYNVINKALGVDLKHLFAHPEIFTIDQYEAIMKFIANYVKINNSK